MELSLLNLAIDSKLSSNDLLSLKVSDVSSNFLVFNRVQYVQKKTGNDVQFEITVSLQSSSTFLLKSFKNKGEYLGDTTIVETPKPAISGFFKFW